MQNHSTKTYTHLLPFEVFKQQCSQEYTGRMSWPWCLTPGVFSGAPASPEPSDTWKDNLSVQSVDSRKAGPDDLLVVTPPERHDFLTFQTNSCRMEQEQRVRRGQRSRKGERGQFLFPHQSPQLNPGGCFIDPFFPSVEPVDGAHVATLRMGGKFPWGPGHHER